MFIETINDKEIFTSRIANLYMCVALIHNLIAKDDFLVEYSFLRPILIQK
jgi:hypothetical protein